MWKHHFPKQRYRRATAHAFLRLCWRPFDRRRVVFRVERPVRRVRRLRAAPGAAGEQRGVATPVLWGAAARRLRTHHAAAGCQWPARRSVARLTCQSGIKFKEENEFVVYRTSRQNHRTWNWMEDFYQFLPVSETKIRAKKICDLCCKFCTLISAKFVCCHDLNVSKKWRSL